MVSLAETPLTGEPDAGEPPVRFGGRGGAHPAIPTPIMRCRDSARRLRTRAAFGVRQLAGALEEPHCTRRPARPLPPSTNDRMDCSPDAIAHSRAGFDPGPMVTISWRARFHPGPYPAAAESYRTGCAAATPHGGSERAKRMECASLLALSKSRTAPRDLPGHCRLPQTTGWIAHPTPLTLG